MSLSHAWISDHICPALASLQGLSVNPESRIEFKILVLPYQATHSQATSYLKEDIVPVQHPEPYTPNGRQIL